MAQVAIDSGQELYLHLMGEQLTPLPEGALRWDAQQLLVVSDLHLEKGSSFAARGQMLPPYDTSATLSVVEALMATYKPARVISLGDSFHDIKAEHRLSRSDTGRIRTLTAATDWIWVEGNHDPDPPAHLGGRASKAERIGPLVFRHEPTGEAGEVAGHLHPVVKVAGRSRSVRRKCYVTDGKALIMPALGAFTGGLNILDEAFEPLFSDVSKMVFALGQNQIVPVSRSHMRPDVRKGGARWTM